MIQYTDGIDDISEHDLTGFFIGWPNPPSQKDHLEILRNSTHIYLAIEDENGKVVGFINALSDNKLYAYIPLLEVLPDYKNKGIGSELIKLMTEKLSHLYSIDLCCDQDLVHYYEKHGFMKLSGMVKRNSDALVKK